MKIVTVYRTGGDFTEEYVHHIHNRLPEEAQRRFVCLTNDVELLSHTWINYRLLDHNWPGWWSKMEIFREEPPFLYMDLDTIINGPLEPLIEKVKDKKFVCIKPIFQKEACDLCGGDGEIFDLVPWVGAPAMSRPCRACGGSGVQTKPNAIASGMLWVNQDMTEYYKKFADDPEGWIEETRFAATPSWNNGDQRCMELMGIKPDGYWQDLCPGLVAHRKHHSLEERQKASVIWYSGRPRPADTGWAI